MARPKKRIFLLFALAVVAGAALVYYVAVRTPASIVLTGVVTTDAVRVGALIQGRIEELDVAPGDSVEKGRMLARIQPQEPKADVAYYKNMEKASAAAVAEAKAELTFFEEQTREQIRQAEANVAVTRAQARQAEADLESARLEYERQKQLREKQLNSAQALDQARTAYEAAQARSESVVKQVQAAGAALSVARANEEQIGARKAELESAGEQLAAAAAQTAKAEVRLAYTEIRAPISGIVDVRAALTGEVVTPGQTIVTLIDLDDLWVRADVEESYIDRVRLGDKLEVRLPSGAARECDVFFRGVDADYATQRDVSRTKRDIKTFEIRLRCDNRDRSLALGMSAYVTLPLRT
jgi:HlyD family secretion protein